MEILPITIHKKSDPSSVIRRDGARPVSTDGKHTMSAYIRNLCTFAP